MKRFLAISIDVEPDCTKNWQYSNPLSFTGVDKGIKSILHPLFQEANMTPTYLINNVVLENTSCVEIFKELKGSFELGTHLHPEFIEPDKLFSDYSGKSGKANCCFYPAPIESEKIKNITDLFIRSFGYKPTSFRAGRFSAGVNTISSLKKLGYKVDSSVTPHISWSDKTREKPVDFTAAPELPYFIKENSILETDIKSEILEIPVTIGLMQRNPYREIISSIAGFRHVYRKEKITWLRPFYSSFYEMKRLIEDYSKRFQNNNSIVFNMMFHNVEVLPGLSPYTSSKSDCKKYIKSLADFLKYCNKESIKGLGLTEVYDELRK
jgi:hypothetical protein